MLIAPVTGAGEWNAVGFPLPQKTIHLAEESLGIAVSKPSVAPEYPDTRLVRQCLKGYDRHRTKHIVRDNRETTSAAGPGTYVAHPALKVSDRHMLEHFPATLALIGIVVLVSSLLSGWVERTGLPQVAIFLVLGLVLGPFGLGLVDLRLRSLSLQVISTLALVLVLFSDAIGVDVGEARRNRRLALFVLGPGTLLPALIISAGAWLLL